MILFEGERTDAAFWFAAEEYIMRRALVDKGAGKTDESGGQAGALMLWVTDDTVMLGANQVAAAECDITYTEEAGIAIVRRPSGGGTIYTDRGTLQYTVILPYSPESSKPFPCNDTKPSPNCTEEPSPRVAHDTKEPSPCVLGTKEPSLCVHKRTVPVCHDTEEPSPCVLPCVLPKDIAREWLAEPIIRTLARYGAVAVCEGRNDVLIDGKKISGTAQHIRYGYICSHGSLLVNADIDRLARTLTVDREKIRSKAIASVRSRVTNIKEYIKGYIKDYDDEKGMREFRENLIGSYKAKTPLSRRPFSAEETMEIERIAKERYANPEWIFGHEPAFTFTNKKRFPGGQLEIFLDVRGGLIKSARINGDFLALLPVTVLEEALQGVPHRREALEEALSSVNAEAILGSLGKRELLETLV